ncbi:hypothetical protein [Pontibacter pudoricolor]|uniref:hypothetical protein n=1 Tax=Pontibacter pudoricolor TaxID=2694930 RepID=UPI001390AF3C|nr:hypothetical protein [Pontibacter pudoricolor]
MSKASAVPHSSHVPKPFSVIVIMKSLVLYVREELKNIGNTDTLISIGLLIIGLVVGINKYGSQATVVVIFVFFSAFTLFEIVFSGKEIFSLNNRRKNNSIEQGRFLYHLISLFIVLLGLLYFHSRTVYIFTAAFTIIFCFVAGVSMLATKFKR